MNEVSWKYMRNKKDLTGGFELIISSSKLN